MNAKTLLAAIALLSSLCVNAQTYTSTNFAAIGDEFYLTKCEINSGNKYDTTGVGITWDYSNIVGQSQDKIVFSNPTETGFTLLQWTYIFNTNNVNLSSTDGQIIAIGGIQQTNVNNYFKKTTSSLEQRASSFDLNLNGVNFSVKNTFTSADVVYKFPLNYGNLDSSNAEYSFSLPGDVFYKNSQIKRVNSVDGNGTLITPYGTFTDVLRLVSTVNQTDTISVSGTGLKYTYNYRLLMWFSEAKKYPLMIVKQDLINGFFITEQIQYLDNQQFFQPEALFAYVPLSPSVGDTVQFQNLSKNAYTYSWNFDDLASGSNNTSSEINPKHIFNSADTFNVQLIVSNGPLSDTIVIPVIVNSGQIPSVAFNMSENSICEGNTIIYTNESLNGSFFTWNFEGGIPSVSFSENPNPVLYLESGTFNVKLIVSNSNGTDTLTKTIDVNLCSDINDKINNEFSLIVTNEKISFSEIEDNAIVRIFTIDGKIINTQIASKSTNYIDISKLQKGTYIISILGNNKNYNQKFVKN